MSAAIIYWSARNLAAWYNPVGNHHFALILTHSYKIVPGGIWLQRYKGASFLTLGAYKINNCLTFQPNHPSDVQSVRDKIDNPGLIQREPNLNFQGHQVNSPNGSDYRFAERLIKLSLKFEQNTKTSPIPYELFGDNCAAWVNTLFKVAGVPVTERIKAGQFWGIDAGEKILIPVEMFTTQS
jgi:hypothetical protein